MSETLPEDVDITYPDRSPGDKIHQQHHDIIHKTINLLNEAGAAGEVTPLVLAEAVSSHIESETPHPVYDDAPSFALLVENGLV